MRPIELRNRNQRCVSHPNSRRVGSSTLAFSNLSEMSLPAAVPRRRRRSNVVAIKVESTFVFTEVDCYHSIAVTGQSNLGVVVPILHRVSDYLNKFAHFPKAIKYWKSAVRAPLYHRHVLRLFGFDIAAIWQARKIDCERRPTRERRLT